ncbi:NHLP bacteriocin system secretion protein [bacterium]|nr:NHLP bacteriocin system secretion protein [bacterium]
MTDKNSKIFRADALERAASPERLDELIQVTDARSWVALLAIGVILAGVLIWSLMGTVTSRIEGRGILLDGDVFNVTAAHVGRLATLQVDVGDIVVAGQTIALIDQPEQRRSVASAADRLRHLQAGWERLRASGGAATRSQLLAYEQTVADARRTLAQREADFSDMSTVKASRAGQVVALSASAGDLLTPGQALATLGAHGTTSQILRAVLYLETEDGKKVRPGMRVNVVPDTVKPEEHGFIIGAVTSVAAFPSTTQNMMQDVRNELLVRQLATAGAPFRIEVELLADTATPSGYAWTSADGPRLQVAAGTLCDARIAVKQQRPIELVIPAIRKMLYRY